MWVAFLFACFTVPAVSDAANFGPPHPITRPVAVSVTATGIGHPPRHMRGVQARLMAQRAAEVAAVRNLAAKLGLPNGSRVGNFRYILTRQLPNGAVEVTVETSARPR